MDVIGGVASGIGLRVDEFDQESFAGDSVVVTDAGFQRARPCESHVVPTVGLDLIDAGLRDRAGGDVGVRADEVTKDPLLGFVEFRILDPIGDHGRGLRFAGESNFRGGLVGDDRDALLFVVERVDEFETDLLLTAEHGGSFAEGHGGFVHDRGRVRREELRRAIEDLITPANKVQ